MRHKTTLIDSFLWLVPKSFPKSDDPKIDPNCFCGPAQNVTTRNSFSTQIPCRQRIIGMLTGLEGKTPMATKETDDKEGTLPFCRPDAAQYFESSEHVSQTNSGKLICDPYTSTDSKCLDLIGVTRSRERAAYADVGLRYLLHLFYPQLSESI